jgi:autotransporter-associated beta strand protein
VFEIGLATGANRSFNVNAPITYNFGVTEAGAAAGLSAVQFAFRVDRGATVTSPVIFNVYNGLGGTGTSIASTTVSATSYPQAGGNRVPSSLTTPVTLAAGVYSVQLTTAGTTLNAASPVLAQPSLEYQTVVFGNYRPGATLSQVVRLTNANLPTANNYSQALAAVSSVSGAASISGVPTTAVPLGQGFVADLTVGLASGSTGPSSGVTHFNFSSVPGTSVTSSTTTVGTGSISLSGTGWNWAQAKASSGTLAFGNVRTGSSASSQTVAIGNQTITNASFQDLLNVSGSTNNAAVSATGFSNLAPTAGGTSTSNVTLAANTATAGSLASTVALTYTSNANSVAGLSNGTATFVGGSAPTIATTGGVYDFATAAYSGTSFAFGFVHRGASAVSGSVAIGNQAISNASYQDSLNVSASTGNPFVSATGFTGLAASAGGATRNNLVVAAATGTAGSLASTLALTLVSNANGVAGLSDGTAMVDGGGSITTSGTVYTGQSTWNTNGGGQWGTLASDFGTNWNWSTFDGSPGVAAGFTDTDTATFGNVVTGGTATVTITNATPSVKSVTFDNSTAAYVLAGASGGSLALLNTGTSAALLTVASGFHAITSAVALGSNATLDAAVGSRLAIDGILSGARNLAKTGAGTVVLSGSNTYGGTTTVAAGRLLIHGNQAAATGAITVESGATLGGRGTAGGALTVLAGGTLSPGASIESLAAGATTLSGTSTFFYELDSSAPLSAAADLLVSGGNLSIGSGAILDLLDLAGTPTAFAEGTKFTVISYGSSAWNAGLFTYQSNELADGETFTAGLNQWEINYDDATGGSNFTGDQLAGASVTITAVPEPGTLAILAAGLMALGLRLRRRISPAGTRGP